MYAIYDCQRTFFGGHSKLIKEVASLEEAYEIQAQSEEDLRIYDSEEAELYLQGTISNITAL